MATATIVVSQAICRAIAPSLAAEEADLAAAAVATATTAANRVIFPATAPSRGKAVVAVEVPTSNATSAKVNDAYTYFFIRTPFFWRSLDVLIFIAI